VKDGAALPVVLVFAITYLVVGFLIAVSVTILYYEQLIIAGEKLGMTPFRVVMFFTFACMLLWPDLLWNWNGT
jgi:hypothetical protein